MSMASSAVFNLPNFGGLLDRNPIFHPKNNSYNLVQLYVRVLFTLF